jgi:hypothetical protein
MFDITTEAVADTAFIHLKDAKGDLLFSDGKPVGVTVFGPSSSAYSVVEGRQTTRALRRMNDNDGKMTAASPDERRVETAEDLAVITASFDNFDYPPAGKASGPALFQALYADPTLGFITKQVTKAVGEWGNFKAASIAA